MENTIKSDDHYWDVIKKAWPRIISAYQEHEDKKPIIEYSLPDHVIYAYPANEYIDRLGFEKREDARKIYQNACLEHKMMLFVKDMENRILQSYVTEIE